MSTFFVTVGEKTSNSPTFQQGSSLCYFINGQETPELHLSSGSTVTFVIDAPGHPFYLSSSESGGPGSPGKLSVAKETGMLSVTLGKKFPKDFYYQCARHLYMGGSVQLQPAPKGPDFKQWSESWTAPITLTAPLGQGKWVYVAQQTGQIYRVDLATRDRELWNDFSSDLVQLNSNYDERGLLDLAFHPQFTRNGRYFIFLCTPEDNQLWELNSSNDSWKVIQHIDRPSKIHNGGRLLVTPEGKLFLTVGDGGPQGDTFNRAQDPNSLHGKILAWNVSRGVQPIDGGLSDTYPQIYAMGFRNPWGISQGMIQRQPRIFVADVGWNHREEIDILHKGGNYGWNYYEGLHKVRENSSANFEEPIYEYTTREFPKLNLKVDSSAVIGGYYLPGKGYIFGDFSGVVMTIVPDGETWKLAQISRLPKMIRAFGQDDFGRIYALTTEGPSPDSPGTIYRLN